MWPEQGVTASFQKVGSPVSKSWNTFSSCRALTYILSWSNTEQQENRTKGFKEAGNTTDTLNIFYEDRLPQKGRRVGLSTPGDEGNDGEQVRHMMVFRALGGREDIEQVEPFLMKTVNKGF